MSGHERFIEQLSKNLSTQFEFVKEIATKIHHPGYLRKDTPLEFAAAMEKFVLPATKKLMSASCKERVEQEFSFSKFSDDLNSVVSKLAHPNKTE